jgi:hypothetical protein
MEKEQENHRTENGKKKEGKEITRSVHYKE